MNTSFTGNGIVPSISSSAGQLYSEYWILRGASELDTDFGDTNDSGDFTRGISAGGITLGGLYSFHSVPIRGGRLKQN
jgi:uncharacterized protein